MLRSYGSRWPAVEGGRRGVLAALALALAVGIWLATSALAAAQPLKVVVLGDSLSAGYGLSAQAAFPARLQAALAGQGVDVEIVNAGVSGDTASGGRDRLDWSVPEGTGAVILELGANDALRGIAPEVTRAALDDILTRLKARNIPVLLAGMYAGRNFGADYTTAFDRIYPELAAAHGVPLYPFFLDGVAGEAALNQRDGIHPTAEGVDEIVRRILPTAERFLRGVADRRAGSGQ
jgi:acyl-CoA thioesterase-1